MTDPLAMLTVKEVRAWLRVSDPFVRRRVAEGTFRATHVGQSLRIYRASVITYLELQSRTYRPKGARATLGERTAARYREGR